MWNCYSVCSYGNVIFFIFFNVYLLNSIYSIRIPVLIFIKAASSARHIVYIFLIMILEVLLTFAPSIFEGLGQAANRAIYRRFPRIYTVPRVHTILLRSAYGDQDKAARSDLLLLLIIRLQCRLCRGIEVQVRQGRIVDTALAEKLGVSRGIISEPDYTIAQSGRGSYISGYQVERRGGLWVSGKRRVTYRSCPL
jgi:hypothetical protein